MVVILVTPFSFLVYLWVVSGLLANLGRYPSIWVMAIYLLAGIVWIFLLYPLFVWIGKAKDDMSKWE